MLLSGRSEERLAAEAEAINAKEQGRAHWVACDLARDDAAGRLAQAVADTLREAGAAPDAEAVEEAPETQVPNA